MAEANPTDQDAHNAEIAKVREQINQAKADLAAEEVRMTVERAALDAQAYKLMLDQNASQEVMRRKFRSHLPSVFEGRDLFNTAGAGTSNQPVVNRAEAPGTGAPVQPRVIDLPRHNTGVPQVVPTPPDHYSNPLDNLVTAAARLEAIPVEGDSLQAIETRRVKELLRTALVQQEAYSYSRERIHSTPRPGRSYSRNMEEPAESSNARRRAPHGNNPAPDAQDVVDRARAHREAELAAPHQAHQITPVRPTTSVEPGLTSSALGVPCLVPALRNVASGLLAPRWLPQVEGLRCSVAVVFP